VGVTDRQAAWCVEAEPIKSLGSTKTPLSGVPVDGRLWPRTGVEKWMNRHPGQATRATANQVVRVPMRATKLATTHKSCTGSTRDRGIRYCRFCNSRRDSRPKQAGAATGSRQPTSGHSANQIRARPDIRAERTSPRNLGAETCAHASNEAGRHQTSLAAPFLCRLPTDRRTAQWPVPSSVTADFFR
jgi:hypothetical protein